jgi:hypothetical protein
MIIHCRHVAIGSLRDLSDADGVVTLLGKKVFCLFQNAFFGVVIVFFHWMD